MRKFLLQVGLLAVSIIATCFLILWIVHANGDTRYLAAIIDKHAALKSAGSPKIILVGGSNLALGVDSGRIEQEMGLPVVNMGLHGGLGLRYMLNEIKPNVDRNDIIVISPEYQQFFGLLDGDETLLDMLTSYPEGLQYINSPPQIFTLLRKIPLSVQGQFKGYVWNLFVKEDTLYYRSAFNQHGDMVSYLNHQSTLDFSKKPLLDANASLDDAAIKTLKDFNVFAQARRARAFVVFPAIPEPQYQRSEKVIQLLFDRLKQESSVVLLAAPKDYVFPLDFFFDTAYHLNATGREIRTEKMIVDLEKTMGAQATKP